MMPECLGERGKRIFVMRNAVAK